MKEIDATMRRITATSISLALATSALFTAATGTASAAGGFHRLALKTPTNVQSVFVSGRGTTDWSDGPNMGTVGSHTSPVPMDVCYTITSRNNGDWKEVGADLQAHTNQAPGRQGVQRSNPSWKDNTQLSVLTFTSSTCTNGAIGTSRRVTVPGDSLQNFWLSL